MSQKNKKIPEKSISEKVNHHKGERNALKKRVKNLEKRLLDFETRLNKHIAKEPVDNWGGYNKKKQKDQESFREKFLREHHPNNKKEEE